MATLDEIAAEVKVCTLCTLHRDRNLAVPGEGPNGSALMFVGEAPGRVEDIQGRPFVGRAGKVFDRNLEKADIDRRNVFVTGVVKCRPPHNRVPYQDEIDTCVEAHLQRQIKVISPKVICLLGGVAIRAFLDEPHVSKARGRTDRDGQIYFATYHPAAAGRNPAWEQALYEDLCKIRQLLK